MRYFFRVEYDGTRYGGWQYQPNCMSVQQIIEEALTIALRAPCGIVGAGRTDAGVHARAQGAHFDLPDGVDQPDIARLTSSLNALLPYDVAVYGMKIVRDDLHARYSAVSRSYNYYLSEKKTPLNFNRAWPIHHHINWDRIEREISHLTGVHDFAAFCASGADTGSTVCSVTRAELSIRDDGVRVFSICANRFIYKMVRSITGTLVDIGRGRLDDSVAAVIASKDRGRVGETAPARGLVLERVDYPPEDRL